MERAKGTAALEKAFDLLEAIGLSAEGLEPQQLNAQVNLPRATLYRLLGLLIDRGMIRRDTHGKRYRLGFRYLEMVRGAWMRVNEAMLQRCGEITLTDLIPPYTPLDGADWVIF